MGPRAGLGRSGRLGLPSTQTGPAHFPPRVWDGITLETLSVEKSFGTGREKGRDPLPLPLVAPRFSAHFSSF